MKRKYKTDEERKRADAERKREYRKTHNDTIAAQKREYRETPPKKR